MNATTGCAAGELDHLRQSIRDILTTPVGSRVMRRDYGSRLPFLVDAPINRMTLAAITAESVAAIARHEKRFRTTRVTVDSAAPGRVALTVEGRYRATGSALTVGVEVAA